MESNIKKFKRETKLEAQRAYKLAHQTLCIKTISFDKRSLFGYVELTIHPLQPDLRRIKVNSKQCKIYHIAVNEKWEAKFLYNDPTMEICQEDGKQRNLDFFQNCHLNAMTAVNADSGNGEITIKLPVETFAAISDLQPIKINIEFSLEQPKGGVHFVVPEGEGDLADRGAHMFTYGHENSSRLWFPCVDSFSECCTWKLELTCDLNMTAVSCGDLIEVLYTSDRRRKTYHYFVPIPTSAPSIAMAVGPFETLVDPNMHEVTHFCLPHLKEVLKHTTSYIHEAFEFYEEMLASRYPYSCYKQVFVDESYADVCPYATMTIFSTNLLHSARIIEQTILTRKAMASAVAKQFFGCFITMQSWSDNWLIKGISNYLSSLYVKKTFGNNEYRFLISEILNEITTYEHRVGGILLDTSVKDSNHHFSIRNSHTVSPYYTEVFEKKALLIMRMLEIRIGSQLLIQVINKMLSLAYSAASQKYGVNAWTNLKLSTSSFVKLVMTVTGKDIQPFLDLWVRQTGCARFLGTSVFNRKRNVVELELKQDLVAKGALKYVGPLTVTIQELDGSFNHTFKIEENKTKFDITCHSKSRRNKKKKIPLMTGEEVDMDLSAMDADSPVLWLRIDPDMNLLSHVTWEQPDFMWQYQLRFERDVVAQKEAISALENFPTSATRKALTDILEHEHCFYRVRMASCHCLAKVANSMLGNWNGPPAMITIFRKLFGSHSCPNIVRQNNFSNFQHYFLYKTIPVTMAKLRNIHTICPAEVFRFILDLFKYNDNSRNKFSDNYYRASLIDALASTVTPAITVGLGTGPTVESLSADVKIVLEEVVRYLNLDKLLPCYRLTVTNSCLRALRILQKFGHIPCSSEVYKSYMQHGVFRDVRIVAAEMLVDFIKTESKQEDLDFLLDMVENDQDVYFRHETLRKLIQNPPFKKMEHSVLHTQQLVERLWKLMNSSLSYDSRLRCDVADLYFILYGRNRPTCLGIPDSLVVLNLKDKNKFNPSVVSEEMQEMFEDDEDDVETDNVAMDTEDVEVDVMDAGTASVEEDAYRFTDEPEISLGGLHKRKASSPLDFKSSLGPDSNIVAEAVQNEDSNTSMKFKFKVKQEEESLATTTPAAASFLDVSVSGRLSEDSASPPHPESKPEMVAPMSFAGLIPSSASTSTLDALGAQAEDGTNSKSHKAKKKKKKNKHKHKHKHKHDKPDKEHGTLERVKESGHSSGTSTVNSPIVRHEGPISSPEFEVM